MIPIYYMYVEKNDAFAKWSSDDIGKITKRGLDEAIHNGYRLIIY